MKLIYLLIIGMLPVICHAQVVKDYKKYDDKIMITLSEGTLDIIPLTENSVRIKFYKDVEPKLPELIFKTSMAIPIFKVTDTSSKIEIKGNKIDVIIDKQTGSLSFVDNRGEMFLNEKLSSRKLVGDSINGEPCFIAEQSFESPNDEFIFGLGQFQDGQYNLKNKTRRLTQVNSQISLPFIYSSRGYGLLWHQYGLTDFNPTYNFIKLEKQSSVGNNELAEVTTTSGTQKISQEHSLYVGSFYVPKDGIYSIFLDLGEMDNKHYVVIDGKPFINFSNYWLPPTTSELIELKEGEHQVQVVCKSSNIPKLSFNQIEDVTTFHSPNAKLLDYIVFYGPSADSIIAEYRNLSGNAPMFPLWAYGFWQCRERYSSSKELIDAVKEFRNRNLPLDVIVQDWQYWGNNGWGVPQFDKTNYPNPAGFIKELHDLNAHFNISIWSNPDKNSEIGKEYVTKDRFIPNTKWLDYFNPETRKEYWNTLKQNMFDYGVDSWWMDAVEPENDALRGETTHIGLGDFYRLTYPLFVSQAVYEGQRETTSDKRVCILTRSAFLGQQKYGIINWSGDINGTWDSFKRQIVAGLNYTITGLPYWTTDIGGFFRQGQSQYIDEKYHELFIRWFQWGAFNPIFRVHGYQSETEPWKYGRKVEDNIRKFLQLRYSLLPYIYSEAWQIAKNGSTLMRPLIMDFKEDTIALNQPYEFMFGKAILVAPVTDSAVNKMNLYLPKFADWYDFWTNEKFVGGQEIKTDTPIDKIPLFVRAGSIIPLGPLVQYSTEKKWDNLEIRIYNGADGMFVLYEDENDNYNYEKGMYSTITFNWNDKEKELSINDREGAFPGILNERNFRIVSVDIRKGIGMERVEKYDREIAYTGKKIVIKM
ncbi:MAG: DUF5110 domain-containing protein [Melioribacteraceae bacterium]|nr:DUF5110 domain-containing protein [Melioribacteraceae bacterium]